VVGVALRWGFCPPRLSSATRALLIAGGTVTTGSRPSAASLFCPLMADTSTGGATCIFGTDKVGIIPYVSPCFLSYIANFYLLFNSFDYSELLFMCQLLRQSVTKNSYSIFPCKTACYVFLWHKVCFMLACMGESAIPVASKT
jgi:hypothetical protein